MDKRFIPNENRTLTREPPREILEIGRLTSSSNVRMSAWLEIGLGQMALLILRASLSINATAAFGVAASTGPVIYIRAPGANTISIAPVAAEPTGAAAALTVAGTKPTCPVGESCGSMRNSRRHRSSNECETPYRAVTATWRGACKLSKTILSFSSSDQRRRRRVGERLLARELAVASQPTWPIPISKPPAPCHEPFHATGSYWRKTDSSQSFTILRPV